VTASAPAPPSLPTVATRGRNYPPAAASAYYCPPLYGRVLYTPTKQLTVTTRLHRASSSLPPVDACSTPCIKPNGTCLSSYPAPQPSSGTQPPRPPTPPYKPANCPPASQNRPHCHLSQYLHHLLQQPSTTLAFTVQTIAA